MGQRSSTRAAAAALPPTPLDPAAAAAVAPPLPRLGPAAAVAAPVARAPAAVALPHIPPDLVEAKSTAAPAVALSSTLAAQWCTRAALPTSTMEAPRVV